MNRMRFWSVLNRDQRWVFLSSLLTGFGSGLFLYIQPLYLSSLGAAPEQIGATLGISGLVVIALYIPLGMWADRRGRRRLVVLGWGLSALATLGMALAPDWRWFIPAMAVYLLSNFAVPALQGYVAMGENRRDVARKFALISMASSAGSVIAPVIGGLVGERLGLRAVYGAAAAVFGAATLALAQLSEQSPAARAAVRANTWQLLRNRAFLGIIALALVTFFSLELGQELLPKFLQEVRGLSVSQIGWLGTLASLGIVVLTGWLGQFPTDRRRALLFSQATALIALALVVATPALPLIALAYFLHGSNRVARPLLMSRLANQLDASNLSFGFSLYQTTMQVALTAAPFLAGPLYVWNPAAPLIGGMLGLVVTMLVTARLPRMAAS